MMTTYILIAIVVLALGYAATIRSRIIQSGSVGLLYRDGVFDRQLEPGRHRIIDPLGRTALHVVPMIAAPSQAFVLSLMSKDQFSLRLTVVAVRKVTDPRAYFDSQPPVQTVSNPAWLFRTDLFAYGSDRLQSELASGLVAWAGTQTLEEIVANPSAGLEGLISSLEAAQPGVSIDKLLVTELTVPPEVRKMFTEVERARRESLAQLERARGEQASLRALANAARTLQSNPQLAQLRLLQTMEAARGSKTFVLGSASMDVSGSAPTSD